MSLLTCLTTASRFGTIVLRAAADVFRAEPRIAELDTIRLPVTWPNFALPLSPDRAVLVEVTGVPPRSTRYLSTHGSSALDLQRTSLTRGFGCFGTPLPPLPAAACAIPVPIAAAAQATISATDAAYVSTRVPLPARVAALTDDRGK